jgi:hypothetical protein
MGTDEAATPAPTSPEISVSVVEKVGRSHELRSTASLRVVWIVSKSWPVARHVWRGRIPLAARYKFEEA